MEALKNMNIAFLGGSIPNYV